MNELLKKKIASLYTNIRTKKESLKKVHDKDVLKKRDKEVHTLYWLGESAKLIAKNTGYNLQMIHYIIRKDKKRIVFLSLKERYCVFCGEKFRPSRISQIFCSRKCFKGANYRDHLRGRRGKYYNNYYSVGEGAKLVKKREAEKKTFFKKIVFFFKDLTKRK